jgi:hypothetical protein
MLQPKKSKYDTILKNSYKKQLSLEKIDEENQFKSNYTPQSIKYQKQRGELNSRKQDIHQDNQTLKDKEFNKNYHDKKEWDEKKWGIYENIATTAELGNFVPHPVAQAIGKVGSAASVALSARKAKLAYDNKDYLNTALNLGMMGVSSSIGNTAIAKNAIKNKSLDSFEKLISPKEFKSNIVNGFEIGRIETKVPSYLNVLNKKSGQNIVDLNKNRALLGITGVDYSTDFNTNQGENIQNAMGGNTNNNMSRYAQGGDLTRFDEGGLHSQNPLGGVPIGNNNSVEQGETKQNNFVYSNRIFLDANVVSQYNLPKSLIGKSVADATKYIDDKFKGRNDKISQSTKNSMLSKVAEAQESMKPQEPEMEQPQESMEQGYPQEMIDDDQMALGSTVRKLEGGGFTDSIIGQGFGAEATADQKNAALGAGLGTLTTAMDLGKTAFGKPAQDTSGLAASEKINSGAMIGGSTLKGATAGMVFGPWGAGIGALVGAGAGLLGAGKAEKAALKNTNNYAINTNKKVSDNYFAMGGKIDPKKITKQDLQNTVILPNTNSSIQSDRFRYAVGEQSGVQHGSNGEPGYYLYYGKKPGDAGFNPAVNREFVNQQGYNTYMSSPQGQQYRRNLATKTKQPVEQFEDGGWLKNNRPYYMTNPGPITMGPNRVPTESILETGGLKPVGTTVPYTIGAQPKIDISNANRQFTTVNKPGFGKQVWEGTKAVGKYGYENAGNLARYAPIAANALQLAQLKKPQSERLDRLENRYKPEYVDEAQLQNIANQTMNNSVNAIGQSGASQGQLRSSIIGSQLQRTKALSDSYGQAAAQNRATNDRAQTFNLGVDQVNLGQSTLEKDINARNQGAYDTEKSKLIGKIGENIGNVGTEQAYKKIALTTTGYSWLGEFQKMNPNATKEETVIAAKKAGVTINDDKTTKKNALGGYLIKNKVK